MKDKIELRDIVTLKHGQSITFPFPSTKEEVKILFYTGAVGKVMELSLVDEVVKKATVEFKICYGVKLLIDVDADQIEKVPNNQFDCY